MKNALPLLPALAIVTAVTACTPTPPVAYDGLEGVSVKAITVIFGAPLVDKEWDSQTGPVTWRTEVLERYNTPRRIFRNGRFLFDGYSTHEFLLTCDLTATLSEGRIVSATLSGPVRACDTVRAEAEKVAALLDVLQEEGAKEATQ